MSRKPEAKSRSVSLRVVTEFHLIPAKQAVDKVSQKLR